VKKDESLKRIQDARGCLALISRIAARGARAADPYSVGYALEELSQVLFERTGSEERLFEPVPASQIRNLGKLLDELDFVDKASSDPAAGDLAKVLTARYPELKLKGSSLEPVEATWLRTHNQTKKRSQKRIP
jgi:hypothetical protein